MGETYNEMNSAAGSTYVPKTIAEILTEVSMLHDFTKKASILEFHVHEMEREISKIEYFKRDLPHCLHFLEDAIEILKEEMLRWEGREKGPVTIEFLQLKSNLEGCGGVNGSFYIREWKRSMRSAHLRSNPIQCEDNNLVTANQDSVFQQKSSCRGEEGNLRKNPFEGCTLKNRGGAFLPFKRTEKNDREGSLETSIDLNMITGNQELQEPHQQHLQKKQRRCWSPELHKRFVDALGQLGGDQAATPKKIKELMKIDGLTNDEVKSHLQKYRLHLRKLSTSCIENAGSWLTHEYQSGGLSNSTAAHSGSPQGPLQHGGFGTRESIIVGSESMEEDEERLKTD